MGECGRVGLLAALLLVALLAEQVSAAKGGAKTMINRRNRGRNRGGAFERGGGEAEAGLEGGEPDQHSSGRASGKKLSFINKFVNSDGQKFVFHGQCAAKQPLPKNPLSIFKLSTVNSADSDTIQLN